MKYLPKAVYPSIYDIAFQQLTNYRVLFFDLDNTLASYNELDASNALINYFQDLKSLGFKIYIISNNNKKRVMRFCKNLSIDGVLHHAFKPFCIKMKKFLKKENLNVQDIIGIGDQLLTDIAFFNKMHIPAFLVKTLNLNSQKWYTKINRLRERRILKKIKLENSEIGEKIEQICQDV